MLRIVNFKERESDDGSTFFALTIQGGVELVKSNATGSFYATARKTSITSTFDEETCKALLGSEIPGEIVKRICKPYSFTIKETGEIIELSHRYEYIPEAPSAKENMSESTIDDFVIPETIQENNHPLVTS